MKTLLLVVTEIIGLFVDDGSLALAILALVVVVAALVKGGLVAPLVAGAILFVGLVVILGENLRRSAKRLGRD
jgi:hypothetical protein